MRKSNKVNLLVKAGQEAFGDELDISMEITSDFERDFGESALYAKAIISDVLAHAHSGKVTVPTDQGRIEIDLKEPQIVAACQIVATHILVGLGITGIRVGSFEMPTDTCVFCGAKT